MVLLLRMRTGSHLYGLATPSSDEDWIEIYDHCKPYHNAGSDVDITRWPLSKLMKIADRGGHNGLEIMFARRGYPMVDLLGDFRASYRANGWVCLPRFQSACKTFRDRGDEKGEIRARMLEDWLEQLFRTGRFDPHWKSK